MDSFPLIADIMVIKNKRGYEFFLNISLSIGVLHGILSLVENGSKGLSAGLSMWHDAWLKMVP